MGGCRCAFRDCPVGTSQFPGMHFFHFPINYRERYLRWLNLANVKHFLGMPFSFQKNRVVCARHFRVECFKNYKRERIIANKSVEPTLMRLNEDTALDYANEEQNGGPELIKIPECTMKHLIPPPGYTFAFSLHDNLVPSEYIQKKNIILGKSAEDSRSSPSEKRKDYDSIENEFTYNPKKFRILNSEATTTTPSNAIEITSSETILKINFNDCGSMHDLPISFDENSILEEVEDVSKFNDDEQYDLVQLDNCIEEDRDGTNDNDNQQLKQQCEELAKQLQDKDEKHDSLIVELSASIQQLERQLEESKEELKIKEITLHKNQLELSKVNVKLKEVLPYYEELDVKYKILEALNKSTTDENLRLTKENIQLREKCKEYEKQRKQKEVEAVTTSRATSSVDAETFNSNRLQPTVVINSMPSISSKAQLFNGVKKYMSSSMVALLRMEMFGNAEREWKPDERRVAMDLLLLGDEIYKYISDEWRFRLPALGEVRGWLADAKNHIDDEEDL